MTNLTTLQSEARIALRRLEIATQAHIALVQLREVYRVTDKRLALEFLLDFNVTAARVEAAWRVLDASARGYEASLVRIEIAELESLDECTDSQRFYLSDRRAYLATLVAA